MLKRSSTAGKSCTLWRQHAESVVSHLSLHVSPEIFGCFDAYAFVAVEIARSRHRQANHAGLELSAKHQMTQTLFISTTVLKSLTPPIALC